MEFIDIIRQRRSIRKYLSASIEREKLELIAEAGIYAPTPGGGQSSRIVMLEDADLIEKIGIVNANCENRNWGAGMHVSAEQPSIIDDLSIKSGFYGCSALGIVFIPERHRSAVNGIGSAFVCAENMVLQAHALGVSSCIVGRAEATFEQPDMGELQEKWGLTGYAPIVFVCLGYISGEYPAIKPRKDGRVIFPE